MGKKTQDESSVLGIVGQIPSVSKSNWLFVVILLDSLCQFEVHSIDSSKTIIMFPKLLNFNWLFLKLHWLICN